jgi:peptidylprolyl isomerase
MTRILPRPFWLATLVLALLIALIACGPAPEKSDTPADTAPAGQGEQPAVVDIAPPPAAVMPAEPTDALIALLGGYDPAKIETTPSGLRYIIYEAGSGDTPKANDTVNAHYTGYLADGTVFDSSVERGTPFSFPLGQGRVIPGWDEGFTLLRPGGKALLIIPPDLGYGEFGAGSIPANATLFFEVELLDVVVSLPPKPVADNEYTTTESGLRYYDFVVGNGATPQPGDVVSIDFTYWDSAGEPFGSSAEAGQPFSFPVGIGRMFPGLDEGVSTMQVGGERQLYIPGALTEGTGLPAGSDFIFEIVLRNVAPGAPESPRSVDESDFVTTPSGVRYADIVVGSGEPLVEGEQVDVEFTVWDSNGELLDSTIWAGEPVSYFVGFDQFPGWGEGMDGIRRGGERQIYVPAEVMAALGAQPIDIVFEVTVP